MPTCTGTPWGVDVWICQLCKPLDKPLKCYHKVIEDGKEYRGYCNKMNCRMAGERHSKLSDHIKHMKKAHGVEV